MQVEMEPKRKEYRFRISEVERSIIFELLRRYLLERLKEEEPNLKTAWGTLIELKERWETAVLPKEKVELQQKIREVEKDISNIERQLEPCIKLYFKFSASRKGGRLLEPPFYINWFYRYKKILKFLEEGKTWSYKDLERKDWLE